MPGSLKMVWGWCIYPVKGKLAECPGEKTGATQGAGLRFGLSAAGWRLSPSMPWRRSKMICGIWADKLAFHTEQCIPGAGGSEEQMPVKQLAKLPQAAPGQTDARLPHGSICSGCSVLQWRSLSCSLQLVQAPSWLLLHPGLPAGSRSACCPRAALSCQLAMGVEWDGGQAQLPQQLSPQTAAITGCLCSD